MLRPLPVWLRTPAIVMVVVPYTFWVYEYYPTLNQILGGLLLALGFYLTLLLVTNLTVKPPRRTPKPTYIEAIYLDDQIVEAANE